MHNMVTEVINTIQVFIYVRLPFLLFRCFFYYFFYITSRFKMFVWDLWMSKKALNNAQGLESYCLGYRLNFKLTITFFIVASGSTWMHYFQTVSMEASEKVVMSLSIVAYSISPSIWYICDFKEVVQDQLDSSSLSASFSKR